MAFSHGSHGTGEEATAVAALRGQETVARHRVTRLAAPRGFQESVLARLEAAEASGDDLRGITSPRGLVAGLQSWRSRRRPGFMVHPYPATASGLPSSRMRR